MIKAEMLHRRRRSMQPVASKNTPIVGMRQRAEYGDYMDQMVAEGHNEAVRCLIQEARYDFEAYLLLFNPPEHTNFVMGKLHRYLAQVVQGVVDGTAKKRQTVSVPPQHGKSLILAREAVSWVLGRLPGIQLAVTSYSMELVLEHSHWVRSRVDTDLYRAIFPNAQMKYGSNRSDSWSLTNGSGFRAKSVGSKLTGRRVDWLVVDDPHAGRAEAESITKRHNVQQWYDADCFSRLSPGATIFIIMTRWHPEDLVGYLTSDERVALLKAEGQDDEVYQVTNLTALCEDQDHDPLGRKDGEALFGEVRDEHFLASIKASMPPYEWASQYQGRPQTAGSGDLDLSKIVYIDSPSEVDFDVEVVRGWDLALTEQQRSDWTAGALCGYDQRNDTFYILDMFRNKRMWPVNKKIVLETADSDKERWNVQRMGIEAVAGFRACAQDVQDLLIGECKVEARHPPQGGKLTRALPWMNKVHVGKVVILRGAWVKNFIMELTVFPDGDHDDQIDAVSVCWEMLTGRWRNGVPPDRAGKKGGRPSNQRRPSGGPRPGKKYPTEEDATGDEEEEQAA